MKAKLAQQIGEYGLKKEKMHKFPGFSDTMLQFTVMWMVKRNKVAKQGGISNGKEQESERK